MKKKILYILLVTTILSCQKQIYTQISRGIYSIEEMEELLPPEVTVERIDDDKYIKIEIPKRTDSNHNKIPSISASNTRVAISYSLLETVIDKKTLYEGRIDLYEYENNEFILKQNIFPPVTKNYIDNGKYLDTGQDVRDLSKIKLSGEYLLVDGGGYTNERKMPQYDNIKSKDELFRLIKENDEIYDRVYLYKKSGDEWKLHQKFSSDLGTDSSALYYSDEGLGFKPTPYFGNSLDLNGKYCFILDAQLNKSLYFYTKDSLGLFVESSKYPITRTFNINTSISHLYSIFTKGYSFDNRVIIINNESTRIEATIQSPKYSDNVSFGSSVLLVDDIAFIGESYYGFHNRDIDKLEENFPGYVHIYKRGSDKVWKNIQTLTSPFGTHNESFGCNIISNKDYLVVESAPSYNDFGTWIAQPTLFYIYKIQADGTYKLTKVLIGFPDEKDPEEYNTFYYMISFFKNGLLIGKDHETIRYIPDLFEESK